MGILTFDEFENIPVLKHYQNTLFEYIIAIACDNPFCDCGYVELVCLNEHELQFGNPDFNLAFQGNAHEKDITMFEDMNAEEAKKTKILFSYLNENLEEEDWDKIKLIYFAKKALQVDEFIVEDESDYEYFFEDEHIDDPFLRIFYRTIFPLCELFVVEKDGIEYELVDLYCKQLECGCSEMNFSIYNEDEFVGEFEYDYKKQEVDKAEYIWVIDQLIENYEDFNYRLEVRNLKVRCLYGMDFIRAGETLLENELFKENKLPKIELNEQQKQKQAMLKEYGRNDKCPCGSGKKFKKCCLNEFK